MSNPTNHAVAGWSRRRMLALFGAAGTGAVFSRALLTLAADRATVDEGMIRQAEWISGIELDNERRALMVEGMQELVADFEQLRQIPLDNGLPPALLFSPQALHPAPEGRNESRARPLSSLPGPRPDDDELAYLPVSRLSALIRTREISSEELTGIYLDRLERFDPRLELVITRTAELALEQARRADRELAAGAYRGPLQGIPWGAKDLLAVPPFPTTWGATPYKDQVRSEQATVVSRLAGAGAVLTAKLTLGALAWGDVWFGGRTRNPWNVEQGSSGSSAGPAAATAAGLVGFAIGSETWGSIVSPCSRCGVTGLRPSFGRVSRYGAMALSWSMDKLGPIARSVEDCALVFDAIHGRDWLDPTVVDRPFDWPLERDPRSLRVGYVAKLFEQEIAEDITDPEERELAEESLRFDRRTLARLEEIGIELIPIELPDSVPVAALSFILTAEAATAFDELTRGGRDRELVRQVANAWPNVLRQGQFIPAVEYLRANRIRWQLMQDMEQCLAGVDVYVCPSFGGDNLLLTNLTGHPSVVLPNGHRASDGTPTSITFNGRMYGESELLAVAWAYQDATDYHLRRPPLTDEGPADG
ncbi:MAG TPA: amidase [Candidatus Polarisedimenticolaceae bacterium]|nr:amidase [Candidatus Polarisedimenticolaceae bacterium]